MLHTALRLNYLTEFNQFFFLFLRSFVVVVFVKTYDAHFAAKLAGFLCVSDYRKRTRKSRN